MDSMMTGVLVVAGVAAISLLLRAGSRGDGTVVPPSPGGAVEPDEAPERDAEPADSDAADETGDEVAVLSSDGWTFVPFGDGVRLWTPAGDDADPTGSLTRSGASQADDLSAPAADARREPAAARPAVVLSAGDLIAARVVPGAPGEAPWCLEALGRDREFSAWAFESEEAARAAREMLERLVVKIPVGPDGEPEPVSDEEIEEARRIAEETLRELAAPPESDPPPEVK